MYMPLHMSANQKCFCGPDSNTPGTNPAKQQASDPGNINLSLTASDSGNWRDQGAHLCQEAGIHFIGTHQEEGHVGVDDLLQFHLKRISGIPTTTKKMCRNQRPEADGGAPR